MSKDRSKSRRRRLILSALTVATCAGCGTVKQSNTDRTATEQILLTNAWDEALAKVDFRPLAGVPVYLDTQYVKTADDGWVISSLRQALLSQGVLLRSKPELAQWIVEARVGSYGTDSYNWMIGIPQTTVPQTITGMPSGTIPKISLAEKNDQFAHTKMALFAYDRASGQMIWRSGTQLASANAKDVYVGGFGPIQTGTIRKKNKRVGVNLPMLSDPEPETASGLNTPHAPSYPAATMPLPASAADLESFSPRD